jgi:hypothetical protein
MRGISFVAWEQAASEEGLYFLALFAYLLIYLVSYMDV